jgi:hypothetical protein
MTPRPESPLTPNAHPVDCEFGWIACWAGCDGGYFDGYEDDPFWYSPGDVIVCSVCHGTGGWPCPMCPSEEEQED